MGPAGQQSPSGGAHSPGVLSASPTEGGGASKRSRWDKKAEGSGPGAAPAGPGDSNGVAGTGSGRQGRWDNPVRAGSGPGEGSVGVGSVGKVEEEAVQAAVLREQASPGLSGLPYPILRAHTWFEDGTGETVGELRTKWKRLSRV